MKFQDSSFNGLKVTVGTKSVTHAPTHPPTHAPKAICPINFFKVGGIIKAVDNNQVTTPHNMYMFMYNILFENFDEMLHTCTIMLLRSISCLWPM